MSRRTMRSDWSDPLRSRDPWVLSSMRGQVLAISDGAALVMTAFNGALAAKAVREHGDPRIDA